MATKLQEATIAMDDSMAQSGKLAEGKRAAQTGKERPFWKTVAEIGAQIPKEAWEAVPDDASINYKHYLYGSPKKRQ